MGLLGLCGKGTHFISNNKKKAPDFHLKLYFVGVDGFEPPTLCL